MPDFVYFTVTGFDRVLQTDYTDAGGEPDFGVVTALVTFTPSVSVIEAKLLTPATTVLLEPCRGRIEEDGRLKTLDSAPLYYVDGDTRNPIPTDPNPEHGPLRPVFVDGDPAYWTDENGNHYEPPSGTPVYGVRLLANSEAVGPLPSLTYKVEFSHVVYDRDQRTIPSFSFAAPESDVTLDLATLTRL